MTVVQSGAASQYSEEEIAAALLTPISQQIATRAPLPAERRHGRRRHPRSGRRNAKRAVVEVLVTGLLAVGMSALLNTFVVQTFLIPSSSMASTLNIGDRVVVSRLAPDLFDVHRGDIVVFEDSDGWLDAPGVKVPTIEPSTMETLLTKVGLNPTSGKDFLIKRVIGVGGDTVEADGTGAVTVNGVPLDEPYLDPGTAGSTIKFSVTVPAGSLWVMGDNRENSADSRYHVDDPSGGFVPLEDVYGIAKFTMFPLSDAGVLTNPGEVFADVPTAD